MKARLHSWLLHRLLGPLVHYLQPMPVQPGDWLLLPAKNPARTGNTEGCPVQVMHIEVRCSVQVRYTDGYTSSYILTPERLLELHEAARRA